jgi:DNA-binding transcriptional MerR regulator
MRAGFTIGRLAGRTGCKVQTVRYYEQIGLLRTPARSTGNQRLYAQADVDRLAFIRHSRALGFPLEAIRDLLRLSDDPSQSCAAVDKIARAQLVQVLRRIDQLQALKAELERMVEQCRHGQIRDCHVIEVLGDHARCLNDDHDLPEDAA